MYKNIAKQILRSPPFTDGGLRVEVLRLDLLHPNLSGNKWFKLKHYLEAAKNEQKTGIVSFGGAFSNHLVALAYACHENGLKSTGIIRGEKPHTLNPSCEQMQALGMQLIFVSRQDYRHKTALIQEFLDSHPEYYPVPEGGCGDPGVQGAAEIMKLTANSYSHVLCAVGTGTTMAGLINGGNVNQTTIGISCLKIPESGNDIVHFIDSHTDRKNYQLVYNYHFGGYAKRTPALLSFMNTFYRSEHIPTDFVYTGKLFFAAADLASKGFFPAGSDILIVHSGGLQGNRSLSAGLLAY